jgi:hypothetical protein
MLGHHAKPGIGERKFLFTQMTGNQMLIGEIFYFFTDYAKTL